MKNNARVMLALMLLAQFAIQAGFATKKEALQAITSTHTRVFSRENLLLTPSGTEDVEAWKKLTTNLQEYVEKNNNALLPELNTCIDESNQLLYVLYTSYLQDIKPALNPKDQKEGLSGLDAKKIDFSKINFVDIKARIKPLKKLISSLQAMQDDLEKKRRTYRSSWTTYKERGDVAEVIKLLAMTLEDTMKKVIRDFSKLSDAASA